MAALYGRLRAFNSDGSQYRGETTKTAHHSIVAKLETWEGSIEVTLERDGSYVVKTGDKSYPRETIAEGLIES